jgi:hypothetical protein
MPPYLALFCRRHRSRSGMVAFLVCPVLLGDGPARRVCGGKDETPPLSPSDSFEVVRDFEAASDAQAQPARLVELRVSIRVRDYLATRLIRTPARTSHNSTLSRAAGRADPEPSACRGDCGGVDRRVPAAQMDGAVVDHDRPHDVGAAGAAQFRPTGRCSRMLGYRASGRCACARACVCVCARTT